MKLPTKLLSSLSVFSKLVSGSGVFVVTGYFVSPEDLGMVSVFFAYCSLICLISDFGLQNPTFRSVAINGIDGVEEFNKNTLFRLITFVPVSLFGIIYLYSSSSFSGGSFYLFFSILGATLLSSHAEFLLIFIRGIGRYGDEAWISILTGFSHIAFVGGAAYFSQDILKIGVAMLLSRAFFFVIAFCIARRHASVFSWRLVEINSQFSRFWENLNFSKYYAFDSVITASFSQIDILFVNYFFGMHASGVYQLASKVMQISLSVVQVFSATYIPLISKNLHERSISGTASAVKNFRRALIEMTSVGIVFAMGMIFVLPHILSFVFGKKFAEVNVLWLGLGICVVGRCLAAPVGIVMIALDKPKIRLIVQALVTFTYVILSFFVFPYGDFSSAANIMAVSIWVAAVLYFVFLLKFSPIFFKWDKV